MDAWRYGIYLLLFTFDISLVRCAHSFNINEFHISARPCIILYLTVSRKVSGIFLEEVIAEKLSHGWNGNDLHEFQVNDTLKFSLSPYVFDAILSVGKEVRNYIQRCVVWESNGK